jgi:hypothetical protein
MEFRLLFIIYLKKGRTTNMKKAIILPAVIWGEKVIAVYRKAAI